MTGYALSAGLPRTSLKKWLDIKAREIKTGIYLAGAADCDRPQCIKEDDFKALDISASTIVKKHGSLGKATA